MKSIVAIQVLRAVAAVSVVLCHFNQIDLFMTGRRDDPIPLYFLSSGVDLFFVISGFIMVYSSGALFGAPGGIRTFITRRLTRIVPLYWLLTMVYVLIGRTPLTIHSVACSLLFVPCGDPNSQIVPLLGVGWTLNYEMMFYALFSVALFWRRSIALILLLFALGLIALLSQITTPTNGPIRFWLDPIVIEFAFGVLIAVLYERGVRLSVLAQFVLIGVSSVVIYTTQYRIIGAGLPSGWRAIDWGLPCAAIFASLVLREPLDQDRATQAFMTMGDASYSLYLLHPIISLTVFLLWIKKDFGPLPASLVSIGGAGASIALSIIVFRLVERPTTRLLHRALLPKKREQIGVRSYTAAADIPFNY